MESSEGAIDIDAEGTLEKELEAMMTSDDDILEAVAGVAFEGLPSGPCGSVGDDSYTVKVLSGGTPPASDCPPSPRVAAEEVPSSHTGSSPSSPLPPTANQIHPVTPSKGFPEDELAEQTPAPAPKKEDAAVTTKKRKRGPSKPTVQAGLSKLFGPKR